MIELLQQFASIPSVSTDPAHKQDMRKAVEWLCGFAERNGWKHEVWETRLHPTVFIETGAGRPGPTLLIYGHYDVQPAEDVHLWKHPPFQPQVIGRQIFGRGVSDNKGQILGHLIALSQMKEIPINVKVLIEGEEEVGSPNLPDLLRQHKERLQADLVLVSDTSTVVKSLPTIHYSLRGIMGFEIFLETAGRDVHSGVFGGSSPNAIHVLCSLIAKAHDENERVTIPGFYDQVRPMEDWEKENLAKIPFDEAAYKSFIGCSELHGEAGFSTNERRWFRPTLECHGISGGFQGEGFKTIVPARASAKFSCRMVPDQEGPLLLATVRRWFEANCPPYARMRFEPGDMGPFYLMRRSGETQAYLDLAAEALKEGFGKDPVFARHGGAIPIVSQFHSILGLDTVLMGFGSPDDAIHSPNEKFELDNFEACVRASQAFIRGLSTRGAGAGAPVDGVQGGRA